MFLGHIILEQGIRAEKRRINGMLHLIEPQTVHHVDKNGYALAEDIKSNALLTIPDITKEFYIDTDASIVAIGAAKYSRYPRYNCTNTRRELLSIVKALEHYRSIILGSTIIRWKLIIEEVTLNIKYLSEEIDLFSDTSSRCNYIDAYKDESSMTNLTQNGLTFDTMTNAGISPQTSLAIYQLVSSLVSTLNASFGSTHSSIGTSSYRQMDPNLWNSYQNYERSSMYIFILRISKSDQLKRNKAHILFIVQADSLRNGGAYRSRHQFRSQAFLPIKCDLLSAVYALAFIEA
ncbi:hypothetical protein RF11_15050 [Thelohanellus kitauei]|uniref:Reverse transcriptase/retrotransposon-derived protein RNase H-like domain-containing protein n=1 Tax=Thelohanellus kitauei TaxID=669202 RepID=A0A0C2M9Y0_THEKT|nr:hypothetical protein RF11_15050 [Thelohanellus kitauei]